MASDDKNPSTRALRSSLIRDCFGETLVKWVCPDYNVQSLYGNSTFRPEICPPYHPVHLGGRGRGSRARSIFFSVCLVFFSPQNDRFSYWALHLIRLQDSKDLAATNSDLLRFFSLRLEKGWRTFFLGRKFMNSPLELRLMISVPTAR